MQGKRTVEVAAKAEGFTVLGDGNERTPRKIAAEYVREAEGRGSLDAALVYRTNIDEFLGIARKDFPSEITRVVIFDFLDAMRKKGNGDRTLLNKFMTVKSFLRFAGVSATIFPPKPKVEKKKPTVYTPDNAGLILAACDPRLRLVLTVALKCGLREQDTMHLERSDLDTHEQVLKVQSKPEFGFKVKDAEERPVPVPADLMAELIAWDSRGGTNLLLPTPKGKPDGHLLRRLKRTACDAGLNCGRCRGCKGQAQECQEWQLYGSAGHT